MKTNFTILLILTICSPTVFSQISWSQKADFGGEARHSADGFSVNNKGYAGTENDTTGNRNDFWEYRSNQCLEIAKYPLNGNINDYSGNNNNGTYTNATLTADRFGNANSSYSFNGLNQYAVLPALNFTNEMTISVWVMFPQIDSSQQEIITKYDADIGSGNQTTMRSFKILKESYQFGSQFDFQTTDNGAGNWHLNSTTVPVANQWYHVTGTFNNGVSKIYVNGVLENSHVGSYSIYNSPVNILCGASYSDLPNPSFFSNVVMDDIHFFDCSLNDNEVNLLYQSGASVASACDTLYYNTTNITWFGQTVKASDGNIVSVGTANHLYNWSNGDIFLHKYDTSFNLIWSRQFYAGGGMDVAGGVLATSDGGYLIHSATGNSNAAGNFSAGYIIKTDSSGNQQWVQTLTGQSYGDNYSSIAVENSQGEFICYGHVQNHTGCNSYATRITKLSSTGSIVWSNCVQLNQDWTGGITKLNSSDNYISAFNNANNGTIELRKWDDIGNQIGLTSYQYNNQQISVGSVRHCQAGGFFVLGRYNSNGSQKNAFIAKFDDSMNFLWETSDSTYAENHFYTLTEDSQGNIFCTGAINEISQPSDLVVTQFNSTGLFQNKGIFGSSTSNELSQGIIALSNGDIICSGGTDSMGLLVKFCGLGNNTTSISENSSSLDSFTMFPNPVSEFLDLTFEATATKPYTISIYNLEGQKIFNKKHDITHIGTQQLHINLNNLSNGLYFIHLENGKKLITEKFIVAH
ncbi:MAG: T9SS type A sorting domain-containing protein [Bacteroidetes bacterium]|nr:T9SS type A sorting domain-containing protein [Bacteroidota bacterium]